MENESLFDMVIYALGEKKAKDVKAIDISRLTTIAQYFVICSGTSVTHIKTLADFVEEKLMERACTASTGKAITARAGYFLITATW